MFSSNQYCLRYEETPIILSYKLRAAPAADYTISSVVIYEQTVKVYLIGNELILYTFTYI